MLGNHGGGGTGTCEGEWKGGREDTRLCRQVRKEKKSVLASHYERIRPFLDKRGRRLWAGNEAIRFGRGGIRAVAESSGMSQVTVIAGVNELKGCAQEGVSTHEAGRQRRSGVGRKAILIKEPQIVKAIEEIVDPGTRGDPMAPLKWTCRSLKNISEGSHSVEA